MNFPKGAKAEAILRKTFRRQSYCYDAQKILHKRTPSFDDVLQGVTQEVYYFRLFSRGYK